MRGFVANAFRAPLGRHWGDRVGVQAFRACKLSTSASMDGLQSSGVKTVSAEEAQNLLKEGYSYLDVRTPEEFSAGHVENAVNIPYKYRSPTGMTGNPKFAEETEAKFDKDAKLVVACQGGMRSAAAAKELQALKYSNLVDMAPGFGGWTHSGLPITK